MSASQATLIIFDLDGTLVDTLPATFHCFQKAVRSVTGDAPSRDEILERFGPADHEIISRWVGEENADRAVRVLYKCYETAFNKTGPFEGMIELIEDLRGAGKKTALFTGRGRPSTDILLESMGLDTLMDYTVTGEEVPEPKPAPDGIQKVLKTLNTRSADAVYVGDTVKDIQAASAAGVTPIAALWGSPETDRLRKEKALKVRTVSELSSLLGLPG